MRGIGRGQRVDWSRALVGFIVIMAALWRLGEQPVQAQDVAGAAAGRGETLPADLGSRPAGEDWPAFLGPRSDSTSSETGLHLRWNQTPPPIVWQTRLGASYGICSISRGRCFQFDRVGNVARLRCLHSETGEELWQYTYPTDYEDLYNYNNGPRCSPVIDGDRVYLLGAEGQLHCVRISDATKLWSVDTARDERFGVVQNFFGVGSTPVIEGDLVICLVGGSREEDRDLSSGQLDRVRGNGTGIVAFDKYTGEVRYAITDELASYATIRLAEIDGRRWGFAFARGGLVGFEPTQGTVDFQYPWRAKMLESVNASTPVVVGDQVFISETYGPGSSLLQVAPGKFDVVWADSSRVRQRAMQTHWNTAVYVDGYLYGSSGRHTGNAELRCIEWATGDVQWSEPDLTRCSLLAVDGHLICQEEYGRLHVLRANPKKFDHVAQLDLADPQTGLPLLRYPAWAAPILSHGFLYVRGKDRLVCLDVSAQTVGGATP